jgi:hypothetical protein
MIPDSCRGHSSEIKNVVMRDVGESRNNAGKMLEKSLKRSRRNVIKLRNDGNLLENCLKNVEIMSVKCCKMLK